jgi:hypothetical protein
LELKKYIDNEVTKYNKMNDIIKGNFGKQVSIDTKLDLYIITSRATLNSVSEI